MKKLILISALFITLVTFAQVPQGISYQAIALNGSGNPVVSSNVRVRLSILDSSVSGTVLFSETHLKTTTAQGLFNLTIGQGTLVSGAFNTINWGSNAKFLKVEMDATGGTTYVNVGTTQLLSVPYAMAADSLITSAGEGITLVSPNGTPYVVSVNDSGQLSLPTSGSATSSPTNLYMYGSFNSFDPTTALLMTNTGGSGSGFIGKEGYKYLTAGTELKFLSANNVGSPVYGVNGSGNLTLNGSSYPVTNNGFYRIDWYNYNSPSWPLADFNLNLYPIGCKTDFWESNLTEINATYSAATNKFTIIVNGVTLANNHDFYIVLGPSNSGTSYGDLLGDGSLEAGGDLINFPNLTTTPKNFKVEVTMNFNGGATYTITQI